MILGLTTGLTAPFLTVKRPAGFHLPPYARASSETRRAPRATPASVAGDP